MDGLRVRDYRSMFTQIKPLGFDVIGMPFSLQAPQSRTTGGIDFSNGKNAALNGP